MRNLILVLFITTALATAFFVTRKSEEIVVDPPVATNIEVPKETPNITPVPTSTMPKVPTILPKRTVQWGAYTGWEISAVKELESKVGKKPKLLSTFVHWGNEKEFPKELADYAKANGMTLIIFWESMDYNVKTPDDSRFSYDSILAGKWDSYITSFAEETKKHGKPIILIPFEEANGDWYPWSGSKNGNTPAKHIEAYRYLRKFFSGVSNVKFAWDMNSLSVPNTKENSIDNYYPGDSYVDYLGINGFNFDNPWQSFSEIFNTGLARLESKNKPIYIFSMASAHGSKKADWITNALKVEIPKHPKIAGWVWFNENKEKDWRIWSDNESLNAFKSGLP